jgi:hypothetical protein
MRGRPAFGPISPYPTVLLRANRGTGNRSQRSEMYQLDRINADVIAAVTATKARSEPMVGIIWKSA